MLIAVENLFKEFRTDDVVTPVLHGISLGIEAGEFVSIMGPSGSGKSTLMHILGFLDRPTSGTYQFHDKDVTKLPDDELARLRNEAVGFVFQSFNLLPRTTVLDNVALPLIYSQTPRDTNRARNVLKSVGLGHRLEYYSNQISGGEKQRVAIARALVNKPKVIFADEPTGNLDSKSGVQVMAILQKLNQEGTTVIVVTHETYTAEHANRMITIHDGKITNDSKVTRRRVARLGERLK